MLTKVAIFRFVNLNIFMNKPDIKRATMSLI